MRAIKRAMNRAMKAEAQETDPEGVLVHIGNRMETDPESGTVSSTPVSVRIRPRDFLVPGEGLEEARRAVWIHDDGWTAHIVAALAPSGRARTEGRRSLPVGSYQRVRRDIWERHAPPGSVWPSPEPGRTETGFVHMQPLWSQELDQPWGLARSPHPLGDILPLCIPDGGLLGGPRDPRTRRTMLAPQAALLFAGAVRRAVLADAGSAAEGRAT